MISLIVVIVIASIYYFVKRQYFYWENSGIPHTKPNFPFGNLRSVVKRERSFGLAIFDVYNSTKEQLIGIYLFFRPAILIRDVSLVKSVLTTDFSYFHDRGVYHNPKADPMSANLFSLEGEEWKSLRTKLTPAFTSGKLKGMFDNIRNVSDNLVKFLQSYADEEKSIDVREFASRYVADCLASIAFGQEGVSSIDNPDNEFRMTARKLNQQASAIENLRRAAVFVCPEILKFLRIKSLPKFMRDFCLNMVTETTEKREKTNQVRKDLMQYLIQLRNNNVSNEEWKIGSLASEKTMSFEQIAAHVFVFYIAGNESSSSTIAYTIYEMTQNEKLMQRAQDEIKKTLEKHDGKLTYEAVNDMKFIDNCIKETLRKYPGLPILNRECTKDYRVPDSDIVIKKGTPIIISLLGLHRDEKYFPNAMTYDPDRFLPERSEHHEDAYMAFGLGPRSCLAFRMGLIITKVAVIKLLLNFDFDALSIKELDFDFRSVGLLPQEATCVVKIKNHS